MTIPRITRHFLKGWRTRIFAFIVFAVGVVEVLDPFILSSFFGPDKQGLALVVISAVFYFLRQITDSPPGNDCTETWFHSEAPTDTTNTEV